MIYSDSLEWKLAQALISRRNIHSRESPDRQEIDNAISQLNSTARLLETQEFLLKNADSNWARRDIIARNPYLHKVFVENILNSANIRHLSALAINSTVLAKDFYALNEQAPAPAVQQKEAIPSTASKIADWVINLRNEANAAEEILESAVAVSQEQTVEEL